MPKSLGCEVTAPSGGLKICEGENGCCPSVDFNGGGPLSFARPEGAELERRRAAARARLMAAHGGPKTPSG